MHKHELIIRSAEPGDEEAIVCLAHELAMDEGGESHVTPETVRQDMLGDAARCQALLAEENGEVIGMAVYYPGYDLETASHGYHLADVVVTRQKRGKGVGSALMKEVAARVLAGGGVWLSWTVLRSNKGARHFYARVKGASVDVDFMAIGKNGLTRLAKK